MKIHESFVIVRHDNTLASDVLHTKADACSTAKIINAGKKKKVIDIVRVISLSEYMSKVCDQSYDEGYDAGSESTIESL